MSKNKILLFLVGILSAFPAFAVNNAVTVEIDKNISEAISAVMSSSGSDIYVIVMAIATFLMFVCIVAEILR
ncbi:TPA: conjugal transfer protein TrbL, partial [Yersinia enterocolitica]